MSITDEIRREQDAAISCRDLIEQLVEAAEPVWRWGGDLPGDWVVAELSRQMLERYEVAPDGEPARYRKKRVGNSLRTAVYERDGYACVVCGVRRDLSLDHIVPEVEGGLSTFENLQTMCRPHNSQKGVSL